MQEKKGHTADAHSANKELVGSKWGLLLGLSLIASPFEDQNWACIRRWCAKQPLEGTYNTKPNQNTEEIA